MQGKARQAGAGAKVGALVPAFGKVGLAAARRSRGAGAAVAAPARRGAPWHLTPATGPAMTCSKRPACRPRPSKRSRSGFAWRTRPRRSGFFSAGGASTAAAPLGWASPEWSLAGRGGSSRRAHQGRGHECREERRADSGGRRRQGRRRGRGGRGGREHGLGTGVRPPEGRPSRMWFRYALADARALFRQRFDTISSLIYQVCTVFRGFGFLKPGGLLWITRTRLTS